MPPQNGHSQPVSARNGQGNPTPVVAYRVAIPTPKAAYPASHFSPPTASNGRGSVVRAVVTLSFCPVVVPLDCVGAWPTLTRVTTGGATLTNHPGAYPPVPTAPVPAWTPPAWVPPVPVYPYAHWGRRVGAFVLDVAPACLALVPFWIGYGLFYVRVVQLPTRGAQPLTQALLTDLLRPALLWMALGLVLLLPALGWLGRNRWWTAGRTGQSWGKRVLGTALIAEVNGRPMGAGHAFLRDLLHVLDVVAVVGLLWPLWHPKRQTFADLLVRTVVVDRPRPSRPGPPPPAPHTPSPYGAES